MKRQLMPNRYFTKQILSALLKYQYTVLPHCSFLYLFIPPLKICYKLSPPKLQIHPRAHLYILKKVEH